MMNGATTHQRLSNRRFEFFFSFSHTKVHKSIKIHKQQVQPLAIPCISTNVTIVFGWLGTLVEWDTPMQVTETLAFSLAQYETVDHTIALL